MLLAKKGKKLLKSANVSWSYSKNKSGFLFWNTVYIEFEECLMFVAKY